MKKLLFLIFFCIFELILCAVIFDYSETVAIVKMRTVIEKEAALTTHKIDLVINYTLWFSLKTSMISDILLIYRTVEVITRAIFL